MVKFLGKSGLLKAINSSRYYNFTIISSDFTAERTLIISDWEPAKGGGFN
jgi:hypothetical protein